MWLGNTGNCMTKYDDKGAKKKFHCFFIQWQNVAHRLYFISSISSCLRCKLWKISKTYEWNMKSSTSSSSRIWDEVKSLRSNKAIENSENFFLLSFQLDFKFHKSQKNCNLFIYISKSRKFDSLEMEKNWKTFE